MFEKSPVNGTVNTASLPGTLNGGHLPAETTETLLQSFRESIKKGISLDIDRSTLAALLDVLAHKESIDDRKMLLEHGLVLLSKLPPGGLATTLQNGAVKLLYNDLPHPAQELVGDYGFRTADGSYNNINIPDLGKSYTPYSRSVPQTHPLPLGDLPDPGLVFDNLLRREKFVKHPAGLSSAMFAFAALVIHTVFQTSHSNVAINETSSYVDLAPLYGDSQADQDKIRPKDGYGLLYPDVFSEDRLMLLPPACCVILVCFNRNHNFIARKIYEINERETYADPSTLSKEARATQDEDIFQTARLCNIAWFGAIVFSDYFSAILGLVRSGSSWSLNPFGEIRNSDHTLFERGAGNSCSVEFNCLYRWHATTSAEDEKWVEKVFDKLFDGKPADDITVNDFMRVAAQIKAQEPDIQHWTFGGMTRQPNGSFKSAELANLLQDATEHAASSFGARKTPHIMRLHEIMGIQSNRRWGVCSLNDFRKFLGLKPYASFLEWNPDPVIANSAERLYGTIDRLELYVGLQAEETKPVEEGAGLCPGYTVSRAILSDAIALTRGDRFFTTGYTPANMTTWGLADCTRDPNGAGFGSMLGRLLLRALPDQYSEKSIYTWFPLQTPESMTGFLKNLKLDKEYDLTRPGTKETPQSISDYAPIFQILNDSVGFKSPAADKASLVIPGKGFFIASHISIPEKSAILKAIDSSTPNIGQYFATATRDAIRKTAYTDVAGTTTSVNIVHDVLKYVPLRWAATELAGIELKTRNHPQGSYTEDELYDILSGIYSFIFLEVEASKQMKLQEKVKSDVATLLHHISNSLTYANRLSWLEWFLKGNQHKEHHVILHNLKELGFDHDQLAVTILAIVVATTVELSATISNAVNLILSGRPDGTSFVKNPSDIKQLENYAFESLRVDPLFKGTFRIAQTPTTIGTVTLKAGDRVFLDLAKASSDPKVFQNPSVVDTTRAKAKYLVGDGSLGFLGPDFAPKVTAQVLSVILSLPNIRLGPGRSGKLNRFPDSADPLVRFGYLDPTGNQVPWPTSLVVQFDTILTSTNNGVTAH
jgi:hypothetical protein